MNRHYARAGLAGAFLGMCLALAAQPATISAGAVALPVDPLPGTVGTPAPEGQDTRIEVVSTPIPVVRQARVAVTNDPLVRVAAVGESLDTIAAQTGFTVNELAQRNKLTLANALLYGQPVRLPAAVRGAPHLLHRVTATDTLLSIAAQYGVSPLNLESANRLACAQCLAPGQLLRVPQQRITSNLPEPFEDIEISPQVPSAGDVVTVRVVATERAQSISGTFGGMPLRFAPDGAGFVALVGIPAMQKSEVVPVSVRIATERGPAAEAESYVQLGPPNYGFENVFVGAGLANLLQPDVNQMEAAELAELFGGWTEQKMWTGPFKLPAEGEINSYFGSRRSYNGGILFGFHSGMDVRAWVGTSVHAAAPGRVAKVTRLAVRGIVVVLDHGHGVYTVYCHLSEPLVKVGQLVTTGDVIAKSGNTGRSEGPHIHFELAVNGVQVDPLPWLSRTLP